MKNIYKQIFNYLNIEPRARERKNYSRAMINLLLENYPELKELPKDKLVDFCRDFESYARIWRKVVEENKDLRGKDYNTKDKMEGEYQINIGYEPNYKQNSLKLKTLLKK